MSDRSWGLATPAFVFREQENTMKRCHRAMVLAAVFLSYGCAAILGGGSSQTMSLQGTPSEAQYAVTASSGLRMAEGTLPATISLPRKNEYQVEVSLDGYQTRRLAIAKGINGWLWLNLLFWPGFIVDFASGAAYKLEPAFVNVTLQRGSEVVALVRVFNNDQELLREERLIMVPIR